MTNNFDKNTMNNIKNMVDSGNIQGAISQISPEMIENFSKMMNSSPNQSTGNTNKTNNTYTKTNNNSNNYNYNGYNSNENSTNSTNSSFDFSSIDMNTLMKMKSIMDNMNNKNDPSYKLLNSLKPYMRESRQEKIDQYANLLNISKIAEAFNNNPNN